MTALAKMALFLAGAVVVVGTLGSAMRTVVLPRRVPADLTSAVFATVRRLFDLRLRPYAPYGRRSRPLHDGRLQRRSNHEDSARLRRGKETR